jgi:hypothetical protein
LPQLADDWSPYVDLSCRHYVRFPDENRPFCLNSMRAAHSVETAPCQPEGLDREGLLQLLDKSSEQFADYQLWYRAPESGAARETCESAAA